MSYQPIDDVQLNQLKIEWVEREAVRPNAYNPNKMHPQTRRLLLQSLLEDGWTQPIVTLPDHTIVDGEQRWTVAGMKVEPSDIQDIIEKMETRREEGIEVSQSILDRLYTSRDRLADAIDGGLPACLASVTGGMVPITVVDFKDDAHKMISTIRHNTSRGSHAVDSVATIVGDLTRLGLDMDNLQTRLGMSMEESKRLLEKNTLAERFLKSRPDYTLSPAQNITSVAENGDNVPKAMATDVSNAVSETWQEYVAKEAEYERQVATAVAERVELAGSEKALTQADKEKIERTVRKEIEAPKKPNQSALRKFSIYVTKEQFEDIMELLGTSHTAQMFLSIIYAERVNQGYTEHRDPALLEDIQP